MKYWIDKAVTAAKKYAGVNNWISLSDIVASMLSTDTSFAATTSKSGVVELATTAEVSTGTDTKKVVTAASMAKYKIDIERTTWVDEGTNSTYSITGETHGKGLLPIVTVLKRNSIDYESTLAYTYSVVDASGDVTITILTASVADARIIIN